MRKVSNFISRIAMVFTVSVFMFLAVGIYVNAASDEVVFDFTQGKKYRVENRYIETSESMSQLPDNEKAVMLWARLARFYINFENGENIDSHKYDFVLCNNPKQIIRAIKTGDEQDTRKYMEFSADNDSKGTFEIVYTETLLRNMYDKLYTYKTVNSRKRDSYVQDVFDVARYTYGKSGKTASGEQYIKVKVIFSNPDSVRVEAKEDGTVNAKYYPAEFTVDGIKYTVHDKEVTVVGAENKKVKALTIPETVSYDGWSFNVTSIDSKAFYSCKKLKKVTINATGIKSIGKKAFRKKTKKLVIRVPKSQYKTYKKMFKKAGMKTIKIRALKG